LKREIKITEDGSKTLFINDLNETYHSHHGALQEAEHVFIKNGLNRIENYEINILELGFGTGLNTLVTLNEFLRNNKNNSIHYLRLKNTLFQKKKFPNFLMLTISILKITKKSIKKYML